MPFLFVDYDSGAGGEQFCAGISMCGQCQPLPSTKYKTGRTKVQDVFAQAFLRATPRFPIIQSHPTLYTVVPSHRNTHIAYNSLQDVHSIRISMPKDPVLFAKLKEDQINKVLLAREPSRHFIGLVKDITEFAVDKNFVRKIKYGMSTVQIFLLAQGLEPTQANIDQFLEAERNFREPEPDFAYDLIVPYEKLVNDKIWVSMMLKEKFGIEYAFDS
jgi:hypothetical protein